MAKIIIPKPWEDSELRAVDEHEYLNRREILRDLAFTTAGLMTGAMFSSCSEESDQVDGPASSIGDRNFTFPGMDGLYPAARNSNYDLDRPLSDPFDVTHYNNFYEFIHPDDEDIKSIYKYVSVFDTRDWMIQVAGLAKRTGSFHLGDLITEMGLEERLYRHRCVEAWAMAVPWTGFPFSRLIEFLEPENRVTHVRMQTIENREQMQGIDYQTWWPWPYVEALSIEEAMNELAFIATGLFGKPLPKQNGAPIRLVVPWKYGFKSIKSIVKIEFLDHQPETFWNKAVPAEYGFVANVDPAVPHPRWSQETEIMIIDGERRATQKYNGYGELVAHLYE